MRCSRSLTRSRMTCRPLRGIDGFSLVLVEQYADRLDERGIDYLKRVRAAAQVMGRQIEDLLRLTRVSTERLRIQPLDLSTMAVEIMDDLAAGEPERDVEVVIPDGLSARGDPRYVRLVLENLLDNAWKFTAKQPYAKIVVGEVSVEGECAYYVSDNGAGFDETYASKLFHPFQRLHEQEDYPGTGIGLTSVQWIVKRHEGRVWAEGAPGQGATFYFTLPTQGPNHG
jgi:light-regulated signal transduction histidine kinase (bacteriophytochrome)